MVRRVGPTGRAGKSNRIDAAARFLNLGVTLTRHLPLTLFAGIAILVPLADDCCLADPSVIVSATATPDYTQRKYGDGKTRPESYVVMQGHYFEGNTVDKSIDRMPFRRITEILAPELAQRQYWPARDIKDADLLIVVHWGTTNPPVPMLEMTAQTSPVPDFVANAEMIQQARYQSTHPGGDIVSALLAELNNEPYRLMKLQAFQIDNDQISSGAAYARIAQLLGYTRELGDPAFSSTRWDSFFSDLSQERYFIILKAYDLHAPTAAGRSRAIWTVWLNMSSPGNNFQTALDRMSAVAADYVGRTTDRVETVRPPREGKVEIGPLVSHGEAE